jgi:DGQHR domain-containing protein
MIISAIQIRQDGQTLYVTSLSAGKLLEISEPDLFRKEGGEEHGYQRHPERPRTLQMARFLEQRQVILPTAITLGCRQKLEYDEKTGHLTIPENGELYQVDGQHRIAGFRVAVEERNIHRLADFPLVTVIIDDTDERLEADQFRIINETSKKVRTDLARRILARVARRAPLPQRRQIIMDRGWETRVTDIIELLDQDQNSPWFGRIQSPNQKKLPLHIIKEKSFGDSLRPLLTTYPFEHYHPDTIAQGLNEYWRAWKQIMDEAPDDAEYLNPFENSHEFVLLKSIPGVFALHLVCRHLWQVFERRKYPFQANQIASAIRAAGGKVREFNQVDDDFTTRRVWHGEDGAFRFYGGLKGATGVARLIIGYLEDAGYLIEGYEMAI